MSKTSRTAIVTGAGRGLGRAISLALCEAGARVVGIARTESDLSDVQQISGKFFTGVVGDAAESGMAARIIDEYQPETLVLCAGAVPTMAPLKDQTWESFSQTWNTDVRHAFEWVTAALRTPLTPGGSVIAMSSGAALRGSPLSGGYAGAKSTIRFLAAYAAREAQRAGLGIDFVSLLPQLTPATRLGAAAVAAYAADAGVGIDTQIAEMGTVVTPELVARCVMELLDKAPEHGAYALTADGLRGLD